LQETELPEVIVREVDWVMTGMQKGNAEGDAVGLAVAVAVAVTVAVGVGEAVGVGVGVNVAVAVAVGVGDMVVGGWTSNEPESIRWLKTRT